MAPHLEALEISARINVYLLDALTEDQLDRKAAKGKTVRSQFAHIHNVRLMWLKSILGQVPEGLTKIEDGATKEQLLLAHRESIRVLIAAIEETPADGRVKGFKPHAAAFVGYLIAHEAHHRGQLELTLRLTGCPIDDKISYGLWEWGVR